MVGTNAQTIVVAGGSLAGHTVVAELDRRGFPGEVVWVRGPEGVAPYSKPALSKELMQGKVTPDAITLPDPAANGLRLRVLDNAVCARLDPDADRVLVTGADGVDGGEWLRFDALFVCTGMRARVPAAFAGVPGVRCLRTRADAEQIRRRIADRPRTVVVGAGLIGSEIAASLRSCGLPVELVEQGPLPMEAVLGPGLGRLCLDLHRDNGVTTRMSTAVTELAATAPGGPVELAFDDGTRTTADLVVLGLGATVACDWLDGAGLDLTDGVGCDAALRTARPNILAAGDAANWPHPVFGRRMRVEHWTNASAQARHAVATWFAGQRGEQAAPYAEVPYFWSDQYGLKFQMVGHARGHDEVRVETTGEHGHPFVTYLREGRVVAAAGVNAPRAVMRMKARIRSEAMAIGGV